MSAVESLHLHGADAAEEAWRSVFPTARMQTQDPSRVDFLWQSLAVSGMTIVKYRLRGRASASMQEPDRFVAGVISGTGAQIAAGRDRLDVRRPWLVPDIPVETRYDGIHRVHAVAFDRSVIEGAARRILGRDDFVLRPLGSAPLSPTMDRHWMHVLNHVTATLSDAPGSPLLEAGMLEFAATTTLATFPSTYLERLSDAPPAVLKVPVVVRRAVAFVDDNAHRPIGSADIAAAARTSTRTLQELFRRTLDTTPSGYLRTVRLAGAHRELASAGPETTTVQAVARRWGFANQGRFAQAYRAAYGHLPGHTLRH